MKKVTKEIIIDLILILFAITGSYVAGWLLFLKPLWLLHITYHSGVLTQSIILTTIIKCILSWIVGGVIMGIGIIIGRIIATIGE